MSRFSSHITQANEIVKKKLDAYSKAEKSYLSALALEKKYPIHGGLIDADYQAKAARANADKLEAENKLKDALKEMTEAKKALAAVRQQLATEVNDYFGANPAEIDGNTMELLKSGILAPSEFVNLAKAAQKNKNFTMGRMIASYAEKAAEEARKHGNNDDVQTLMNAAVVGKQNDGQQIMEGYDSIVKIFDMTCENPTLHRQWDELAGPIVQSFRTEE